MKKYRSLLFDLDGTLTDSGPGIIRSVIYALDHFGIHVEDRDSLRVFVGPPLSETFPMFGVPKDRVDEAIRTYRELYHAEAKWENTPYDGIEDLLQSLQKEGFTLCVATSKPEQLAKDILERFDLAKYFTVIAGASTDHSRETKAAVIEYLLEQFDPGSCVMIGDTKYDVIGAKAFGIPAIGVSWGYGKTEEMAEAGAAAICDTMQELHDALYG